MRRPLLAFLVLPLALAACSGSESRALRQLTPTASVQQAAKKTAAATSEHITLSASGSGAMFNGTVTGSGDFDNANHRGAFHVDVSNYGSVDVVVDGTSAYVKAPVFAMFLPPGKTWVKLNGKAHEFKAVPQDPQQTFARLKKLAHVHVVGDETIGGVSTTHYQGTARLGQGGTFDVWVDKDDGYVRRVGAATDGTKANGHVILNFSDFGKPVTVTPPPAAATVDGMNLLPKFKIS